MIIAIEDKQCIVCLQLQWSHQGKGDELDKTKKSVYIKKSYNKVVLWDLLIQSKDYERVMTKSSFLRENCDSGL